MENAPEPLIGSSIPAEEDLPQNSGNLFVFCFIDDTVTLVLILRVNLQRTLEDVLGEVVAEMKGGPPVAAIESEVGDAQPEGAPPQTRERPPSQR
ncbi:UNVERIFIED_CONTAM: hypothetical protein Slati_3084200 [Sesamum latifolium]|uniref:Uncharacterized protein n=1 Tax=Sesamum latifolium TaxID=2727402 RepID=A0AAW2UUS5_9LAMI